MLTPVGDQIWDELREEVLQNYMPWGDRAEEEDAGRIELESDDFAVNDAIDSSLLSSIQARD